jgi:hypothetical protein
MNVRQCYQNVGREPLQTPVLQRILEVNILCYVTVYVTSHKV